MPIEFEWDAEKAAANIERHGISFEEAQEAFADVMSFTIPDPEHSDDEARFVTMGITRLGKLLVVVHTDREPKIRLITAREADPTERKQYEG